MAVAELLVNFAFNPRDLYYLGVIIIIIIIIGYIIGYIGYIMVILVIS